MAKKINVKTSWYRVTADVVTCKDGMLEIHEGFETLSLARGKREQSKRIAEKFEGYEIVAIRTLESVREDTTTTYTVDACNAAIVNACIAYGLDVYMGEGEDAIICTMESESESVEA